MKGGSCCSRNGPRGPDDARGECTMAKAAPQVEQLDSVADEGYAWRITAVVLAGNLRPCGPGGFPVRRSVARVSRGSRQVCGPRTSLKRGEPLALVRKRQDDEPSMTSAFIELLELAQKLGISVRHAKLGGTGGGLAQVKGTRHLFIDLDAMPEDQLDQTLHALAGLAEIDSVFVRPDVRKLLEEAKGKIS